MMKYAQRKRTFDNRGHNRRKGASLIMISISLVLLLGGAAISIGLGRLYLTTTEAQIAADAAALAAGSGLSVDPAEARRRAEEFAAENLANGRAVDLTNEDIELGHWDFVNRDFTLLVGDEEAAADAVRVTVRLNNERGTALPMYFSQIWGIDHANVLASATATYRPMDVMLVLDYSASMNDDSEFVNSGTIGRDAVVANLRLIWEEMGSPTFGNMNWNTLLIPPFFSSAQIKTFLGLNGVAYPFPSGSWDDYFNYVQTDPFVGGAGYRYQYGCVTLVNYWLARQPQANQTPDLWQTTEQPLTAVKDAVSVFFDYTRELGTQDKVGFSLYTGSNGDAVLESGLVNDYDAVETLVRQRQAGHYDSRTNIGAGIRNARTEFEQNGRPNAFKMMVLITDGLPNQPGNAAVARQFAIDEAATAGTADITIVTISLGADADSTLMQEIADSTGGIHFNVPGGQSVADYSEQLNGVFEAIARRRPLRLVE